MVAQTAKQNIVYSCQCYFGNDLFKVVELCKFPPSIYLGLPEPVDFGLIAGNSLQPVLETTHFHKLRFDYAGIIDQIGKKLVARYDYAGLEE